MKAAIRYYTKGGNTEKVALAISKATGLPAETIDVPLLQLPDSAAGKLGYTLVGGQAYDARYEMNDYYVIPVTSDGQLGFIMKSTEGVFEVAKTRTVN